MQHRSVVEELRERCRRCRVVRLFDPWGSPLCTCPPKYSLHPYTGCSHLCLYCYATTYMGFRRSVPKKGFLEKLRRDLKWLDHRFVINMSTSSDPYPPEEAIHRLTRETLKLLLPAGYRVLITTKGSLVTRDTDLLLEGNAAVTITITTLDREVAAKMEPGAPSPRERLDAVEKLASEGVPVGVRIDPIVPGVNDDPGELRLLVREVFSAGARFIVTSTYKARPDNLSRMASAFPELKEAWRNLYRVRGRWMHGYWYLEEPLRIRLLEPVVSEASRLGMEYAVCREGFRNPRFLRARSCDGSHLVPLRVKPGGSRWPG